MVGIVGTAGGVGAMAMKGLRKIARSVRDFGRGISDIAVPGISPPVPPKVASIGLALGGGFARGIVHIGVLKVLEAENIPIGFVAGTSVGALIGAAYCSGVSPAELEAVATRVRFRDLARWTFSRYGFATNLRMLSFLNNLLKVKTFEELRIPLAVTATDFMTGEGVVFRSGPLADPVRASCAYPGVFLPVTVNGRLLVDGMLAHSLPTAPVREMGADRVLAVSLKTKWTSAEGPKHVFEVIGQCFAIAQNLNGAEARKCADLIIEPDVTGYRYDDFGRSAELVALGEASTRAALPEIRKWLEPAPAATPAIPKRVRSTASLANAAFNPATSK